MRLIDIEPFETAKDVSTCEITVWRNGDGYADVATMNTKDIPAVDAVEVVRCKDCKNWGLGQWCETFDHKHEPDFYCFYGERKDNE